VIDWSGWVGFESDSVVAVTYTHELIENERTSYNELVAMFDAMNELCICSQYACIIGGCARGNCGASLVD
jgi:hypothetical protein